jgi:hypothetical protein
MISLVDMMLLVDGFDLEESSSEAASSTLANQTATTEPLKISSSTPTSISLAALSSGLD